MLESKVALAVILVHQFFFSAYSFTTTAKSEFHVVQKGAKYAGAYTLA